jgi:hypothetical protein
MYAAEAHVHGQHEETMYRMGRSDASIAPALSCHLVLEAAALDDALFKKAVRLARNSALLKNSSRRRRPAPISDVPYEEITIFFLTQPDDVPQPDAP